MNIGQITTWLGGSAVIVIAILLTYWGIKWILSVATAGKDFWLFVRNVVFGILILGFFGWTAVNWFYGQMKAGAMTSPVTSDVVTLFGQAPQNFGLSGSSTTGSLAAVPTTGSEQPTQAAQPTQAQVGPQYVSKPARVTFGAITAKGFPDGSQQDICGYDYTQVGNDWVVTQTILCNPEDQPGETVSVDPRTLVGTKAALPAIPGSTAAVIQPPPTAIPPTLIPPTPTPNPAVLAAQCSVKWADWANRMYLHNTKIEYGSDVAPIGVTCQVLSGKSNASEANEVWKLTCGSINIVDYSINGTLGRSIQGDREVPAGSVFEIVGSGAQCSQ